MEQETIYRRLRELGVAKTLLIITGSSVLLSIVIYTTVSAFWDIFTFTGVLISVVAPAVVAPVVSYFFVQVLFKLDSAERALTEITSELELQVGQRTAELTKANEELRAEIIERKRAEKELEQRAQELGRSNAFITALSQVIARIEITTDPDQVMQTLGTELEKIEITCLVATLEPNGQELVIRYTSIAPALLAAGERLIEAKMIGSSIVYERFPIWSELIEQRRAVFVSDTVSLVSAVVPHIARSVIERVLRLGWLSDSRAIWLPLVAEGRVIGGLAMWGTDLRESDLPLLSVFPGQVATALESARLYAAERHRTEELARASEQLKQELSERMWAEEQVKASLKEKEVLLQEIHHRVKNNLQIISSLFSLQSDNIEDQQVIEMLRDSQNRVRSMALVHEKLYRSESLSRIDFGQYIQSLAEHLFRSYGANMQGITLGTETDCVSLGIDLAVPCGLLLNELISNSLKHAFTGEQTGRIYIELFQDSDRKVNLTVGDDGMGFPADLDFRDTRTLGLQLVITLVQQLKGAIELDNSRGTVFKITFSE